MNNIKNGIAANVGVIDAAIESFKIAGNLNNAAIYPLLLLNVLVQLKKCDKSIASPYSDNKIKKDKRTATIPILK